MREVFENQINSKDADQLTANARNAQSNLIETVSQLFSATSAEEHTENLCDLLNHFFTARDEDDDKPLYKTINSNGVASKVYLTLDMIKFINKLNNDWNKLPENRINHDKHFQ